eukprot:7774603-Lingulodinium_polyedra.AAC.1
MPACRPGAGAVHGGLCRVRELCGSARPRQPRGAEPRPWAGIAEPVGAIMGIGRGAQGPAVFCAGRPRA